MKTSQADNPSWYKRSKLSVFEIELILLKYSKKIFFSSELISFNKSESSLKKSVLLINSLFKSSKISKMIISSSVNDFFLVIRKSYNE